MAKSTRLLLSAAVFVLLAAGRSAQDELDPEDAAAGAGDELPLPEQVPKVEYKRPTVSDPNKEAVYFYSPFDDEDEFARTWIKSEVSKQVEGGTEEEKKYDGQWEMVGSLPTGAADKCLLVGSKAKHHAIAAKLDKEFAFNGRPLVVQYEVQFRQGQDCGGAYLKLLSSPSGRLTQLHDKTQYSVMFGPDKCGNDVKLHFIFQHKNPKNGTVTEKHWTRATSIGKMDEIFRDKKWHQLRLVISDDNRYEVFLDKDSVGKGSLLEDFNPPVNPPKEIDDPDDSRPDDWDEREKIPDPEAAKPEDWDEDAPRKIPDPAATKPADWDEDEPEMVPDPEAKRPGDWDPDMDGEWEAPLVNNPKCKEMSGCGKWQSPMIDNPKYKGKWRAPMINNPNFKGKWKPRKIANPDYFEDLQPYKMMPIDAVAFELWTISDNIAFDNVLIASDPAVADEILLQTYQVKKDLVDQATDSWWVRLVKYTNKNPWMWGVWLVAVAIPVVLFIAYCCVSPRKPADEVGERKKTDAPTADMAGGDAAEEEEGGEEDEEGEKTEEEEVGDEEEEPAGEEEDEEGEQDEPEEEEQDDKQAQRQSPRLRKTRARKE